MSKALLWHEVGDKAPEDEQHVLAAIHPYGREYETKLFIVHAVYIGGKWVCAAGDGEIHAPIYWMPAPPLPGA